MTKDQVKDHIGRLLSESLTARGETLPAFTDDTLLLGGALQIDSLDLAGIVVELSEATQKDPFAEGFVEFRTVGELASLYAA